MGLISLAFKRVCLLERYDVHEWEKERKRAPTNDFTGASGVLEREAYTVTLQVLAGPDLARRMWNESQFVSHPYVDE